MIDNNFDVTVYKTTLMINNIFITSAVMITRNCEHTCLCECEL